MSSGAEGGAAGTAWQPGGTDGASAPPGWQLALEKARRDAAAAAEEAAAVRAERDRLAAVCDDLRLDARPGGPPASTLAETQKPVRRTAMHMHGCFSMADMVSSSRKTACERLIC